MDRAELQITAELALVDLDEKQLQAFERSVTELLDHLELMKTFDVSDLQPTTHALQEENRFRPDQAHAIPELSDLILEQVPDLEDRFISIPNVL